MRNIILLFLLSIALLSSCDRDDQVHTFPINKYRGYRVLKKIPDDSFTMLYVMRNDTQAIEIVMPKCFNELYNEGDTIK